MSEQKSEQNSLQTSGEPLTKTAMAIRALRNAILRGEIQSKKHLTVSRIAEQLGMSPTPVREAIRTLQAEGLISHQPHHSISVNKVSTKDIHDIFQLRALLESMATQFAVPRLSNADLEHLESLHQAIDEAHKRNEYQRVYQLNMDWHFKLYHAADNAVLYDTIQHLWKKFMWKVDGIEYGRNPRYLFQHTELMQAIRARDAELASKLMIVHIHSGEETALAN